MNNLELLYKQLLEMDASDFWKIEADFVVELSKVSDNKILPCMVVYWTIVSWFATSIRQGVWTFYESTDSNEVETTLQFLKKSGEEELANIFAYGVHDYQNPIYGYEENQILYPDEWIEESDKIDEWILEHEDWLYQWERSLLLNNKELILDVYRQ